MQGESGRRVSDGVISSVPAGPSRRCAVIGHPVAHSLSPALHRAAYASLGLGWTYTAIDVAPDGLAAFVGGLDRSVWRGLSVTMPHKAELVGFGAPDDVVRLTGVANTLVLGEGPDADRVRNTDVAGFVTALRAHGVSAVGSLTVVGNGATALSALTASHRLGASRVTVTVRSPERAGDVLALAGVLGMDADVVRLGEALPASDLVISTVPAAGAEPVAGLLADSAPVVFDVIYDPWPTPLAVSASDRGRLVLNGLDLLAAQAVDQVRLMTHGFVDRFDVTFEQLRAAGAAELRRREAP